MLQLGYAAPIRQSMIDACYQPGPVGAEPGHPLQPLHRRRAVARDSAQIPANNTYHDNTDYFYDFEGRTRHSYTRTNDYYAGINDYAQTASYYDGNGRLALFERHLGDMQQASLGNDPRAVVESYRYDALGRRVLTHSLRAGNCTAAGCESTVQRFVWDGDQLLYEIRARGDSGAFGYGVEDDLYDGSGIYGAVNAYGRVGYTHAGGIDRPIGAVRGTYWDNQSGSVVIRDARSPDGESVFRPSGAEAFFTALPSRLR